jgi:hypothetical protein
VDCTREIYPIYENFRITEVSLPTEVVFSGFRNMNVRVRVICLAVAATSCAGSMCNKQNLYRNERMENKCSCISNTQRMCSATFVMDLGLQMENGDLMILNNFTSTWFNNNNILTERLATHVRALHFTDDMVDDILEGTMNVMAYINDRGGFRIIGWAKRGMIKKPRSSRSTRQSGSEEVRAVSKPGQQQHGGKCRSTIPCCQV